MTKLPPVKLIKDVLDGLLGKDVATTPADLLTSTDAAGGVLAVYVDDANTMRAVIGWKRKCLAGHDLREAARVGAKASEALVLGLGCR